MGALVGYRTYLISLLQVAFGFLATVDWNPILQDPKAGISIIASGILMTFLRTITTTPPGQKP